MDIPVCALGERKASERERGRGEEGDGANNPDSVSVPSACLAFPLPCFREEGGGGGRHVSMTWIVVKLGEEQSNDPRALPPSSPFRWGDGRDGPG